MDRQWSEVMMSTIAIKYVHLLVLDNQMGSSLREKAASRTIELG
jgi:hypothetical protein